MRTWQMVVGWFAVGALVVGCTNAPLGESPFELDHQYSGPLERGSINGLFVAFDDSHPPVVSVSFTDDAGDQSARVEIRVPEEGWLKVAGFAIDGTESTMVDELMLDDPVVVARFSIEGYGFEADGELSQDWEQLDIHLAVTEPIGAQLGDIVLQHQVVEEPPCEEDPASADTGEPPEEATDCE